MMFIDIIEYIIYNITLETIHTHNTNSKPDILLFTVMNIFLKKLIIDPIMTTGCILAGSSPNTKSIINDNIKAIIINKNKLNESIVFNSGNIMPLILIIV